MHFIITDAWLARSRAVHLTGAGLIAALLGLSLALMLAAATLYHWVFLKGARAGWPVVGSLVRLVTEDEAERRERFLRENLDAMARRLGEMQARLMQLESLGERVSGLAGLNPGELRQAQGQGGAFVPGRPFSMEDLQSLMAELDQATGQHTDLLTVVESRLADQRAGTLMLPTRHPLQAGPPGSGYGWRIDPFTGRPALHTGLDFPAEPGTPVLAAAGGVVVEQEQHPAYGNVLEIDHGNELITRYAHVARFTVRKGDLVRRGQKIAEVGSTGRSTGPHLHLEVLVRGVPQNPQKFLQAGRDARSSQVAQVHPAPRLQPSVPPAAPHR